MGGQALGLGGGGGFEDADLQTQTGDAETQLQEIEIPDEDGWHNVIARVSAQANDGGTEYAAIKRIEKNFRVEGGSIVPADTVDHSPARPLDEVGGLFSASDMTLRDAGNGNVELVGESPSVTSIPTSGNDSLTFDPFIVLVDNNDVTHIFGRSTEKLQHWDSDTGSVETVYSGNFITKVSAEVDSTNTIKIALRHYDGSDGDVSLITGTTGSWSTKDIVEDGLGTSGDRDVKIDLDDNDVPHFAYGDGSSDVKYANRVGGSWSTEVVKANSLPDSIQIYVDSETNVGIAWDNTSSDDVFLAVGQSGSFSDQTISPSSSVASETIDLSFDGADWYILDLIGGAISILSGQFGGSFSETDVSQFASTSDSPQLPPSTEGEICSLTVVGSLKIVAFEADTSGSSDPGDIFIIKNDGSGWSEDEEIEASSNRHNFRARDGITTVHDVADSTWYKRESNPVSATINWRTKALT